MGGQGVHPGLFDPPHLLNAILPLFSKEVRGQRPTHMSRNPSLPATRLLLPCRYRAWWLTTVLVAAITAFLQPYYIAFAPPGL